MRSRKYIFFVLPVVVFLILMSGCATQTTEEVFRKPGFLHGLFHGFTILFHFIGSFFTDYEIYAYPNTGGWYNFGYLLGVSMFFGGSGGAAGSSHKKKIHWETRTEE